MAWFLYDMDLVHKKLKDQLLIFDLLLTEVETMEEDENITGATMAKDNCQTPHL